MWTIGIIVHHQHQFPLHLLQGRSDRLCYYRKNLLLNDFFLQFLHLLQNALWQFHSHIARAFNNAV